MTPYIPINRRGVVPNTPGEVNYKITKVIDDWLLDNGVDYTNLNAMMGVLECSKLELYRRIVALYEDKKLRLNGDVYAVRAQREEF
jgi:hypothetical protein